MSAPAWFIHRPVGTTLLTFALGLSGAIAYRFLPVAPLPQVDFPALSVNASLPGASPETMASSVATPLERQFGRIAGLNEMTSSSTLGSTSITLQFDLSRNIDAAARDVQAGINAARGQLPSNLPTNPTWRKQNPADPPILQLGLTSDTLEPAQIYDAASTILQQKISQIKGVGQVFVGGGSAPAVRVEVDPIKLSNMGLSLEDVRTVLANANVHRPKGVLADSHRRWVLTATDQLMKAREYEPLVVAYRHGAAVLLRDIADVKDSVADIRNTGIANGKPAVLVYIFRQPAANIIDTVDRVNALMPQLKASIPAAIEMRVLNDRTTTIRASVHDVERTMGICICLVILVVFVFLRNPRTTLVPAVVVPISLLGTLSVLYLAGYTLDNLSLLALTIATGFVVDDAIVVIENVTRHIERGLRPLDAAVHGTHEIASTVFSISVSLIAVFIPILLMGGIVGRLFREFAVALSVAILCSLAVSLSTTPMMCGRLLIAKEDQKHGFLFALTERAFNYILRGYERSLAVVLDHQAATLFVTLGTIGFSIYLYVIVPKGFFPQQDTGRMGGQIRADQASSFQAMRKRVEQVVNVVRSDPAVASVNAYVGGGNGYSSARMQVSLKPLRERKISSDDVIERLRPKLDRVPGVSLFLQSSQDLRIGGRSSAAQYQFTLQSDNIADLNRWAPAVYEKLRTLPQLVDVNSDQQDKGLEAKLVIDRSTASRLGISPAALDNTLYDAFGQREVSVMYTQMNQYFVVMEAAPRFWQDPDALNYVYLPGANGKMIPLSAVTSYQPDETALAVNHQGQFPSVTISFNLRPGISLSDAVPAIENAEQQIGLPSNVTGSFQGTALAYQESLASEPLLILAALIAVYIVLGVLYEDLIHPVTILSTLPSAGVGALLALLVTHDELNVISLIGIILLIGIVKKNAIMMIDFALAASRKDGLAPQDAICRACLLRFRPIMMTTAAALLGGLPIALGTGEGAELRRPLGIAVVGGLVFSQMLTLYTTPVVYLYMDRLRSYLTRLRKRTNVAVLHRPEHA